MVLSPPPPAISPAGINHPPPPIPPAPQDQRHVPVVHSVAVTENIVSATHQVNDKHTIHYPASTGRSGGRAVGALSFSEEELSCLLNLIAELLPSRKDQWEQLSEKYNSMIGPSRPKRSAEALKKRFERLYRYVPGDADKTSENVLTRINIAKDLCHKIYGTFRAANDSEKRIGTKRGSVQSAADIKRQRRSKTSSQIQPVVRKLDALELRLESVAQQVQMLHSNLMLQQQMLSFQQMPTTLSSAVPNTSGGVDECPAIVETSSQHPSSAPLGVPSSTI